MTKGDISPQEGAERGCDLLQPCTEKGNDRKALSNLLRNNAQVSNACQKTCCSFVPVERGKSPFVDWLTGQVVGRFRGIEWGRDFTEM